MSNAIQIRNLYKIFGKNPKHVLQQIKSGIPKKELRNSDGHVIALADVSLNIPSGEIYIIMGLSGSGKSTLARCINRLINPTDGQVFIDGVDILPMDDAGLRDIRRNKISMVFQHFGLFPHKSVLENVAFGLKIGGVGVKERHERASQILKMVGLQEWENYYPENLSGGMQQRVGLARALATEADILIMDEAFSALDPLIRSNMQDELLYLQKKMHKTIVFITHDFQEAMKLGDRIAIMADGGLVQEGSPEEIVNNPINDYVGAFVKSVNPAVAKGLALES